MEKEIIDYIDLGANFQKVKKERIEYIDLGAGILMIWVMIFHALSNTRVFGDLDPRVAIPYLTFSMPWFFYKSGQFFNPDRGMEGIKHDAKKLLLPFLIWGTLGYAVQILILVIQDNLTYEAAIADVFHRFYIYGYLLINVPLWFVLSLFAVKAISQGLLKLHVHPIIWMVLGIAIGYLHFQVNGDGDPVLPVYLANVPLGISFFMMGYAWSKYETNKWLMRVSFIVYVAMLIIEYPVIGLHRNVLLAGPYLVWPVVSFFAIVAFNNVCRRINFCKPLNYAGRHAITLLVTHAFIYMTWAKLSPFTPLTTFICIVICYALLLPIVTRVLKH